MPSTSGAPSVPVATTCSSQIFSTIVFGRGWWQDVPKAEQNAFRKRARQAGVSLRSDSLMKSHYVEIRGLARTSIGLSTEQPESPYRR